jgi:hypothetical protein
MEESQNSVSQEEKTVQETTPSSTGISFPNVSEPKKSGGPKTLLIVGILILVGILGFVIFKTASNKNEVLTEPTPFDNLITGPEEPALETPTPTPEVVKTDRAKVKIQIQNGTGITGEAAYLQTQLKALGYTNISVGNSPATVTTTEVTFANSLASDVVNEVTAKLNAIYQKVTTTTSASPAYDIVVVVGLRKGATPKPSATPTPKPSATPTASPTSSPSI